MGLADDAFAAGISRGVPLALVLVPGRGVALAWKGGGRQVPTADPAALVHDLAELAPRFTWWSARQTAAPLVAAGVRPATCWDVGAVGRSLHGLRREDPAAVWAAAQGLTPPPLPRGGLSLLDLDGEDGDPVRRDGHLSAEWLAGAWAKDLATGQRWAQLLLHVQQVQETLLRRLPDPRAVPGPVPLPVLVAQAESAAALLAVELEADGLPVDREVMAELLRAAIGDRPTDLAGEAALRRIRDAQVLRHFPGEPVDLRHPEQVRRLLARTGLDLPDTRSWRLEPHAATSPAVAALLAWRRAERLTTTYGWRWLDRSLGEDGRLRGAWAAADAAAGRMTAQAGLHNLPAELRPAVRAEPGHVLVRGDLGQVEPRVLAAVSRDERLGEAAREDDMYARVAEALRCDRDTAKVAMLAAMYGQTSGAAGAALRGMDRAYPRAMAFLRAAEQAGRSRTPLRTYGGRLLLAGADPGEAPAPGDGAVSAAGRSARNAVVQGAAAELFKAWAATVRAGLPALGGQLVLALHDELLLHVPAPRAADAARLLRDALQSTTRWWASGSGVRFVVEVAAGPSWSAAKAPAG